MIALDSKQDFCTTPCRPMLRKALSIIVAGPPKMITEGNRQTESTFLDNPHVAPLDGISQLCQTEIAYCVTMTALIAILCQQPYQAGAWMVEQRALHQQPTLAGRQALANQGKQLLESAGVRDQSKTENQVVRTPFVACTGKVVEDVRYLEGASGL